MFFVDNVNFLVYNIIKIAEVNIMAMAEKIRIMLVKRGNITETELARRLGISRQNLSNKMSRDNFTEKDLQAIAEALNCTYNATFTLNDTKETI